MTTKETANRRGRPKGSGLGLEVKIGLRLPAEVAEHVDEVAEETGASRSAVVRDVVTEWAERREARNAQKK